MRLLLRILLIVAVILGIAGAGSVLLPRDVIVERRIVIAAPAEAVFPQVNSLQRFAAWSPWTLYDPAMKQSFSGPEAGIGSRMSWESEEIGSGSQEIVASVPNERVEMALDFGGSGQAEAWFELAAAGSGTEVTWGFHSDLGYNPVARYMGLMFPEWIGADFDRGLAALKNATEAK
ncbi:MAG TPA: SRPBCC family protein [Paracoccaceae bacterium]|nr:SRPBCC family protein [Paracoccaceae bacterium]